MFRIDPRRALPLVLWLCLAGTGCDHSMQDQQKLEPLEAFPMFEDGKASRDLPEGTVARGHLRVDTEFFEGVDAQGQLVTEFPDRLSEYGSTEVILARGRQRFEIFCSHCHGHVGGGRGGDPEMEKLVGMVVKRGFPMPPTYHQPRLREAPVGHFFDVISNGFGRMAAHRTQIPPEDRWAIVAWIRTLQFSQAAPADLLSNTSTSSNTSTGEEEKGSN